MKRGSARIVLGQIQTLYSLGTLGGLSEAQLLELFLTRGEDVAEDAFAALVHRHGPMVLSICRRMLRSAHDAEDAFQATFLILARRAASIGRREQLANWLHGVAVRTAKEARRRAARQHARERRLMNVSKVEVENAPDESQGDLLSLLDEELNRLPPRYRTALVACELEGKSRREAAVQLGVPEGTLSTNLARGRKLLRERLVRRGVSLGAGPFAGLAQPITVINVSERLAGSTVRAALSYASGGMAAGTVPATVASLAEGVLKMMLVTRLAVLILIASMVAVAGPLLATDDPSKSELDKYQGTWVLVSEESEGKAVPAAELLDFSYTVRGNKVLFTSNGKDRSATVKLDPSKTPKTYDLLRDDGLLSLKGIYTWDGDNIKICSAADQGNRPTEFRTEPGSKNRIRVWKRKK